MVLHGEFTPFCGGSIITRLHILTAAHCTINIYTEQAMDPSSIQVLVGEHRTDDSVTDRRDISSIRNHPKFSAAKYDFSILTLTSPITFTSVAAPICLPASTHSLYSDQLATVTGWGATAADGDPSHTLQKVDVIVASNEKCNDYYPGKIKQ